MTLQLDITIKFSFIKIILFYIFVLFQVSIAPTPHIHQYNKKTTIRRQTFLDC